MVIFFHFEQCSPLVFAVKTTFISISYSGLKWVPYAVTNTFLQSRHSSISSQRNATVTFSSQLVHLRQHKCACSRNVVYASRWPPRTFLTTRKAQLNVWLSLTGQLFLRTHCIIPIHFLIGFRTKKHAPLAFMSTAFFFVPSFRGEDITKPLPS